MTSGAASLKSKISKQSTKSQIEKLVEAADANKHNFGGDRGLDVKDIVGQKKKASNFGGRTTLDVTDICGVKPPTSNRQWAGVN